MSTLSTVKAKLELVFEDEFSQHTLDTSLWQTISTNPSPYDRILPRGNCNFDNAALLTEDNIVLKNGCLNLIAKQEQQIYQGIVGAEKGTPVGCDFYGGDTFELKQNFTSASLFSRKGYNHGLFECRAKIPFAKGLYPVFWLWHHDEIVVFEFFGDSRKHFVSAHNKEKYVTKQFSQMDYSQAFHHYAVYWTPQNITWFFEEEPIWTICREGLADRNRCAEAQQADNTDYNIQESFPDSIDRWLRPNMSLRIYEWADQVDVSSLPDTLVVDYVRVYQTGQ